MNGSVPIVSLLRYDHWATNQTLANIDQLTPGQFTREFAGELSSVRQQSIHLISVPDRYRARIMNEPVPDDRPESFSTPAEATEYAAQVAPRIDQMIATLTPERLSEEIRHDTRRGVFVLTVEQTLLQVVNHGTYHRGQIACLLKLHGIEPIDSDFIIWVKEASPTK